MYKQVETDSIAILENGYALSPIATLVDEFDGKCQISIDDNCYVLSLKQSNGTYKLSPWIFKEALDVIKTLPSLS